jgi:hypothetical protein
MLHSQTPSQAQEFELEGGEAAYGMDGCGHGFSSNQLL